MVCTNFYSTNKKYPLQIIVNCICYSTRIVLLSRFESVCLTGLKIILSSLPQSFSLFRNSFFFILSLSFFRSIIHARACNIFFHDFVHNASNQRVYLSLKCKKLNQNAYKPRIHTILTVLINARLTLNRAYGQN